MNGLRKSIILLVVAILLWQLVWTPGVFSEERGGNAATENLAQQLQLVTDGKVVISTHAKTGKVRFIGTELSSTVPRPAALNANASPEQAARGFLSTYGELFGLTDQSRELTMMRSKAVDKSRSFVRFQQVYEGVPILGGELIVQVKSANNGIISANGEILPGISLDTTPAISASNAGEAALSVVAKEYGLDPGALRASEPELWIYNPIILGMDWDLTSLVWRVEVEAMESLSIRELVLVDAHLGFIALHFNQMPTAKDREVYTAWNGSDCTGTLPGLLQRSEGDLPTGYTDVDNAYDYTGYTYDFYMAEHGRDSIDDAGMTIISTVDYDPDGGCDYGNAYWNGTQMVFGTGFASGLDVAAHELTHGVTQYESGLYYFQQSGAINESLSDIWGELVELTYNPGSPSERWLMGEDIPGGAIRSMKYPPAYNQPDKMTSSYYYCGDVDNGGVHYNSGVGNKAAYLMVDGGTFNGYVVTGMGISQTADLFYEAQTNLVTSASDYADLYNYLQQAAINLGYSTADRQTVEYAVNATEMNLQPPGCPATQAPVCDSGVPNDLFFDDLENPSSGNWVSYAESGTNEWYYDSGYPASGQYHFWGYDQPAVADYYIAMTFDVALPSGSQPYLHFKHAYALEGGYDGGVVEYSTDGGSSWHDAGALFTHNGYTGTISSSFSNPLGGRSAFTGATSNYISSRLDLSSLAGQSVRFRFGIGTDSLVWRMGWFIDDIRIYTCGVTYTLTTSSTTGGNVTDPGEGIFTYNAGDVVDLLAVPDTGYAFANWTGDVGTVADPNAAATTITMNGNYTIVANFVQTYDLTVSSTTGGNVTDPGEGIFTYNAGDVVGLLAVPDTGYAFVNWTGDVGTVANPNAAATTITMDSNKNVTANFAEMPFAVEVGELSLNHNWKTVNLTKSFTDPVVVAKPLSYNGSDPSAVRIRNVTPTSFEIELQEWEYLDVWHKTEQVSWLAMEKGHWTLPGGAQVEAGSITTDSTGTGPFASVSFSQTFGTTPVVISSVTTFNETDTVATRNRNITTSGFGVIMQEQESNVQSHAVETISYVAWEPGTGTVDSMNYEVATQSGVNNTWSTVNYGPFAGSPYWLADMQTANGGDSCNIRYRNKTSSSVDIKIDEETSADGEKAHINEDVGYFAFPPAFLMEVGELSLNHTWQTVSLTKSFSNPVVVAKPLSHNGSDPSAVRIRNVTSTSFEIKLQEWDYLDWFHTAEQVSWLAMEKGHWTLPGGAQVEAGSITTDSTGTGPFASVSFSQTFGTTPVVISSVTTFNETDTVATRNRNITTSGFGATMQEQESNVQSHAVETISYVAWEPGTGTVDSMNYEVATQSGVNNTWSTVNYGPFAGSPYWLADMQTANGGDSCNIRYRNKTSSGVDLKIDEETSADGEKTHTNEDVGYFAFD